MENNRMPEPSSQGGELAVRRMRFSYPPESLPRHFVSSDIMMSHLLAMTSATFPEGEDLCVRSVRRFRDDVRDPDLLARVRGFIGQETTHGREHRNNNNRWRELGYPTHQIAQQG